jgi:G:T-mismatch repair DNA endonuclease (very short patch repair protein)
MNCQKCGKLVSKNCKSGFCNTCRDRSGVNNPFYGKHHTKETIDNIKLNTSLSTTELWKNIEYRNKVIKGASKPRKPSFSDEQSKRILQWYIDNPEQREIRRSHMKNSWKTGKIEPNINSINESKYEIELRECIKERLSDEYNVKKRTIRIDGKWFYPDIVIDKKIIVEFFGDYWHANPKIYKMNDIVHHKKSAFNIWEDDKKRIEILKNKGYKILIVWQTDYLNNKEEIINKLLLEIKSEKKNN